MTPTFSQTGGARIGFFNATWPFAEFSATSDLIRLSCLGPECSFLRSDIRGLSRHIDIFSTGLRIEHTIAAYPKFIVFWTFRYEALKRGLEGLGYEMREAPIDDSWSDGGAFVVGGLSFVPYGGVLFGIAAIVRGLSSHTKRGKALAAVGAAGIAFNVLLFVGSSSSV